MKNIKDPYPEKRQNKVERKFEKPRKWREHLP
jgi:hypothetical protein